MSEQADTASVFTVTEPEQLKALADSNCQTVLERLIAEPRSPQRVAEALGVKPTKLYYHFHALEKAGLIRKIASHRAGKHVENVYAAVAQKFAVDPALSAATSQDTPSIYAQALQRTLNEVEVLETLTGGQSEASPLMFVRAIVPVSDDRWNELVDFYEAWLQDCMADTQDEHAMRHAFTIALYPIEEHKTDEEAAA